MASGSSQPAAAAEELIPVLTLKGHTRPGRSISYFPDNKRMLSVSEDGTARRWDLEVGEEIGEARDVCEKEVDAVAASRDGRWVVMGDVHGELRVCEVETGTVRIAEGSTRIHGIDISADSRLLASASFFTTWIWSLDAGKVVAGPFEVGGLVTAVRFSQDSKKIAVNSNSCHLEIWDIQTQKLDVGPRKSNFSVQHHDRSPVCWTTKDKTIVAAFVVDSPYEIHEFDASTLATVGTPFKGHTEAIDGLALSFDCALLASSSDDNTIKLWAFESRQLLASFHVQNPHYLIFSPNSHQLAYTTRLDTDIYVCNTPPEILASIQPAQQESRTSAPIHTPLAHLPNSDAVRPDDVRHDPMILARPNSRSGRSTESSTIRHAGTPRIQPADMPPSTDMQRQHYEPGLQSLPQDLLCAHGGPVLDLPSTTISPVVALLPRPRRPPSPVGSRLPQSYTHTRELLPSSSHSDTVLPVHHDQPPEAVLQDLSKYITKDGDYPVARGGFGEIWKCTYSIDQRSIKVAVKALQVYAEDQLGPSKTKKINRVTRELRICANLNHKNILPIYGYTNGFGPFIAIVSPWAENGNLSAYLERVGADITLVRRFEILRDIIAGLQYLHANSVIHGDFNGPNVLIDGDGTACVADFGLSLMYSEVISASQASWTSTLKGNMRWMAPELLQDREDESQVRPSEHSDMYSFGGIMLQALTNKIPYYYLSNDAAIVLCIAFSQTPSRSRYPMISETYWEFIEKCWSTDPRDRPSTEAANAMIRNEYYALSYQPSRAQFFNFDGLSEARLNADQSVFVNEKSLLIAALSWAMNAAMFNASGSHMEELQRVWVDGSINYPHWKNFNIMLRSEWSGITIYSTVMLAVDTSFLSVPSVNLQNAGSVTVISTYISLYCIFGSLAVSLLLMNRMYGQESADTAVGFLMQTTRSAFGTKALATVHGLPHAMLVWGTVYFMLALSYQVHQDDKFLASFVWSKICIIPINIVYDTRKL